MKEHDERFTNYEHRISKLEDMISEPMERIEALEKRCDNFKFELNNKVSNNELYKEMIKKPNILKLKNGPNGVLGSRKAKNYCSESDLIILEDSSGRIRVKPTFSQGTS